MRVTLTIIAFVTAAFAQQQGNGRNYQTGSANGRSYTTVTYDAVNSAGGGPTAAYTGTCTPSASVANPLCVLLTAEWNTGSSTVQSISGCGGTWYKFGSTLSGNGNVKNGEVWWTIPTATSTCTVAVTRTATPSAASSIQVVALHAVNPFTPLANFTGATSGSLNVTTVGGDVALSADFDTPMLRKISGCTTTRDNGILAIIARAEAHCIDAPTSTFTWSAFGTNSLAEGVDVKAQ